MELLEIRRRNTSLPGCPSRWCHEPDPMLVLKAIGLGLGLVCSEIVPKVLKAIKPGGVRCEGAAVRGLGPLCLKIILRVLKAMDQVEYAVKGQQFVNLDHCVQKLFQSVINSSHIIRIVSTLS
ncbi:hypothetical protein Tco_0477221 [Tanacetum coccineum]